MKITSNDFSTNRKMSRKCILHYCENFASYLHHLSTYFDLPLNDAELKWAVFIIDRIDLFLMDCPDSHEAYAARYLRVQTKLKKIVENETTTTNANA